MAIFEMMVMKTSDIFRDRYSKYFDEESENNAKQMYLACTEVIMNIVNFRFDVNDKPIFNLLNKYVLMYFQSWLPIIMYEDVNQGKLSKHLKQTIPHDYYNKYKYIFLRSVILQFDTLDELKKDKEFFVLILINLLFVGDQRIKENDFSDIKITDGWKKCIHDLGSMSEDMLVKYIDDILKS
jgi:hypothetical protein